MGSNCKVLEPKVDKQPWPSQWHRCSDLDGAEETQSILITKQRTLVSFSIRMPEVAATAKRMSRSRRACRVSLVLPLDRSVYNTHRSRSRAELIRNGGEHWTVFQRVHPIETNYQGTLHFR